MASPAWNTMVSTPAAFARLASVTTRPSPPARPFCTASMRYTLLICSTLSVEHHGLDHRRRRTAGQRHPAAQPARAAVLHRVDAVHVVDLQHAERGAGALG